jgi:hypothetical protein
MATTYSISHKNKARGGFDSPEKIKELLENNSKWPAETYNADFRRGVTCLIYTQFSPRTGQFFPVFSAFERLDLGAI